MGSKIAALNGMSYRPFVNSDRNPYHITARCINRDWFSQDLALVWEIMENYLYFACKAYALHVHAFVLMKNHYHLLVSSPLANLSSAMQFFQAQVSREMVKSADRINHIWAHRFKRSEISSYHYFMNCYKYVYRNPVEASIVEKVEQYPYSTLYGLLGQGRLVIPVGEDTLLFGGDEKLLLEWLNHKPSLDDLAAMRKGLKKRRFQPPRIDKKLHPLENNAL
jgi:putative transposase